MENKYQSFKHLTLSPACNSSVVSKALGFTSNNSRVYANTTSFKSEDFKIEEDHHNPKIFIL